MPNLSKSEQINLNLYQTLYDQAPVALIMVGQDLEVEFANRLAKNLLNLLEADGGSLKKAKAFHQYLRADSLEFLEWLGSRSSHPFTAVIHVDSLKTDVQIFQHPVHLEDAETTLLALVMNGHNKSYAQSLEVHKLTFEHVHFGILILDEQKRVTHLNKAFQEMTGFHLSEIRGHKFDELFRDSYEVDFLQDFAERLAQNRFWSGRLMTKSRDGSSRPYHIEIAAIPESEKNRKQVKFYIAFYQNIDKQLKHEEELINKAYIDLLTGVWNRQGFMRQLDFSFSNAQRDGNELALMFIDLDNFKQLNDSYGHEFGDELLKAFCSRLKNFVRPSDVVGRLGGDEFVLLMSEMSALDLDEFGERLVNTLSEPYKLNGLEYTVSASIGAALYPHHGITTSNLLATADSAMYQAKSLGKNRFQRFNSVDHKAFLEARRWFDEIEEHLEQRSFGLMYQPIIDLRSGQVVEFEAIPCWLRNGELIPLEASLREVLFDHPYMQDLGAILIHHLFLDQYHWQIQGYKIPVTIRLALSQLESEKLHFQIRSMRLRYPNLHLIMNFSVSEEVFYAINTHLLKTLLWLQEEGFGLVMDGFGNGQASLHNLRRLSLNYVNLSDDLVASIHENSILTPDTLQGILAMLDALQLKSFARNISTQTQFSFLNGIGCDYASGALFSEPLYAKQALQVFLQKKIH